MYLIRKHDLFHDLFLKHHTCFYICIYIYTHIICNVSEAHGEKYFLQKFNCILMTCVRVVWEVQLLGRLSP